MRLRANTNFHPPRQARPMILIGAGTGLAGLRGHLAHRAERNLTPTWLIFGERSPRADRYYADALEAWLASGVLRRLDRVFSREDQRREGPRYVQDILTQNPDTVRQWVDDDATIFVCGGLAMAAAGRYRRDIY
jgi:sulfite reductase (NADPH) flavoprotein alpha-component